MLNKTEESELLDKNDDRPDNSFAYPDCWTDDERMSVLFAPFRVRSLNVESYEAKSHFWQNLVKNYCEHKGEAFFTISELEIKFTRKNRKPQCLQGVLGIMLDAGQVRPIKDIYDEEINEWGRWMVNYLLKRPANWCINRIKSSLWSAENDSNIAQFVSLPVLSKFTEILQLKVLSRNKGKVLHFSNFLSLLTAANIKWSDPCLRLCLHTLYCQRHIFLEYSLKADENQIELVKIPAKRGDFAINDFERSLIILEMSRDKLVQEISSGSAAIKLNETRLLSHLEQNERTLAKLFLRKKKVLEQQHEKQCSTLLNIEQLLMSLNNAHTDKKILEAYSIGSKALQNILQSPELNYENVDDVVADMCESVESYRDVHETLSNVKINGTTNSDEELERELNDLVNDNELQTIEAHWSKLEITEENKTAENTIKSAGKLHAKTEAVAT